MYSDHPMKQSLIQNEQSNNSYLQESLSSTQQQHVKKKKREEHPRLLITRTCEKKLTKIKFRKTIESSSSSNTFQSQLPQKLHEMKATITEVTTAAAAEQLVAATNATTLTETTSTRVQQQISHPTTSQEKKKIVQIPNNTLNYLINLPSPNPLVKKQPCIKEAPKAIFTYSLNTSSTYITSDSIQDFNLNESQFRTNLSQKEPLTRSRSSQQQQQQQKTESTSQTRKFLSQIFIRDSSQSLIFLREGILKNSIICSIARMEAIRNNKGNNSCEELKEQDAIVDTQIQETKVSEMIAQNMNLPETLVFESKFESGNLSVVSRLSSTEYNLLLQNDINTNGYTQWFYFKVTNITKGARVKFNIINFYKNGSLFNAGMQLSMFSKKKHFHEKVGWFKGGSNISYSGNNVVKSAEQFYYTLSFEHTFEYGKQSRKCTEEKRDLNCGNEYNVDEEEDDDDDDDEVWIAYSIPYTYTQLNTFLASCEENDYMKQFMHRKLLCRSLAGNRVDLITITNPTDHRNLNLSGTENVDKHKIVIQARVHPGETVSSYILEGIMEFLLSNRKEAVLLREKCIVKIIPMLNPDGVIHGNYRTSLAGCDLNRRWKNPSEYLHPEIYFAKKMIIDFNRKKPINAIFDLHAHSKKMNFFAYGCHNSTKPIEVREFPYILSLINSSFSFNDCNFKMPKSLDGTARVALHKSLGISNVFTIESSFCGAQNEHFSKSKLKQIGHSICQSILIKFEFNAYADLFKTKSLQKNHNNSPDKNSRFEFLMHKANNAEEVNDKQRIFLEDLYESSEKYLSIGMQHDGGSDSEASADNISDEELKGILSTKSKKLELNTCSTFTPNFNLSSVNSKRRDTSYSPKNSKPTYPRQSQLSPTQQIAQKYKLKQQYSQKTQTKTQVIPILIQHSFSKLINQRTSPNNNETDQLLRTTVYQSSPAEPRHLYFPTKLPKYFPNISSIKHRLTETRMKQLRDSSLDNETSMTTTASTRSNNNFNLTNFKPIVFAQDKQPFQILNTSSLLNSTSCSKINQIDNQPSVRQKFNLNSFVNPSTNIPCIISGSDSVYGGSLSRRNYQHNSKLMFDHNQSIYSAGISRQSASAGKGELNLNESSEKIRGPAITDFSRSSSSNEFFIPQKTRQLRQSIQNRAETNHSKYRLSETLTLRSPTTPKSAQTATRMRTPKLEPFSSKNSFGDNHFILNFLTPQNPSK